MSPLRLLFIIYVSFVKHRSVQRKTQTQRSSGIAVVVVGDSRDACSTQPSRLDDAFVRSAIVWKKIGSTPPTKKITVLLQCSVIFAFKIRMSNQQFEKNYFQANHLHDVNKCVVTLKTGGPRCSIAQRELQRLYRTTAHLTSK